MEVVLEARGEGRKTSTASVRWEECLLVQTETPHLRSEGRREGQVCAKSKRRRDSLFVLPRQLMNPLDSSTGEVGSQNPSVESHKLEHVSARRRLLICKII